jgi:rare lipoprotein A
MRRTLLFIGILYIAALPGCVPYYEQSGYDQPGYDQPRTDESTPQVSSGDYVTEGVASFMADEMQGKRTASGKIFYLRELTAAHQTLPFGTIVEVTNLKNNKSVQVEVIDRGPFVRGRIIDVSFQAAKELGFVESGETNVRIKVIRMGSKN